METRRRETLSFWLTVVGGTMGTVGALIRRRAMRRAGGGMLFAVGVAGLSLTWHYWTLRCGHHMSIRAFFHPTPLTQDDKHRLHTHTGQLLAGAALLW